MSEKRDDEGFVKLEVVKGSKADKWIKKRRAETPLENSTASKSQTKEEPASTEKKQKTHKEKKRGQTPKKRYTLFYWTYDDNRTKGAILYAGKNFSDPRLLKNEKDQEKYIKQLEKLKVENKPMKLPVGIKVFSKDYRAINVTQEITISAFQAFRMLTQEGRDNNERYPILKLISVILSSYIIRPLLGYNEVVREFKLDLEKLRAINTVVSSGENTYYYLTQICESMIVNTAVDDESRFKLHTPVTILPGPDQDILEVAYLRVRKYREYKWPAPYRDTAVLLDSRYIKNDDLIKLIALNPWCSFIIFGKSKPSDKLRGCFERIEGKNFISLQDWNIPAVQNLVKAYAAYVPSLFDNQAPTYFNIWIQSGNYFARYAESLDSKKKTGEPERFKLRVEVTALLAFLQFVQERCTPPVDDLEQFKNSLLEIILPGCIPKAESVNGPSAAGSVAATEPIQSPSEVFEALLQKLIILENLYRFYPIEGKYGALHPEKTEDGADIWGYIKFFDWGDEDEKTPCLILFEEQLVSLNQEFGLCDPHFKDVLSKLRKEDIAYVHGSKNYKFKRLGDTEYQQPPALRLKISELPIDEDMRQALIAKAIE